MQWIELYKFFFSKVKMISMSNHSVLALSGNGGKFLGGFDINVIQEVQQTGNANLTFDTNIYLKCCYRLFHSFPCLLMFNTL